MKGNYTYLNHTWTCSASLQPQCVQRVHTCIYICVYSCVPGYSLCKLRESVCVCVYFASVCKCGGGCEAAQSPGRTEWIYKLMEFKASSIDYHYNKQQHTECLIIFRQRFCALSSNSADAVTLSDICL